MRHEKKERTARRAPGDNVLPDQFQTVAAVMASDWCQKTCVFLRNLQLMTQQENCKRSAKKRDYSFAANNHQNGRIVKQQQQQIFSKIGNITNSHYFPTRK